MVKVQVRIFWYDETSEKQNELGIGFTRVRYCMTERFTQHSFSNSANNSIIRSNVYQSCLLAR